MTQHPNKNVIEIDVSKAYTSVFCDISEIPIFNEFDAFKPYGDEPILPLNLYVVKDFNHPLATHDRSLVYGQYLQEGMNVIAFKQPSFIKNVDCAKLSDPAFGRVETAWFCCVCFFVFDFFTDGFSKILFVSPLCRLEGWVGGSEGRI